MVKDVWIICDGVNHIKKLKITAWRIVEAQEITSTRKLVDSLQEQKILDELIDGSKPKVPDNYLNFHPLIYTPFRYPPLKNGSRFGKKTEPSIWYGSTKLETALSEKAFYQLQLLHDSKADFENVISSFTIFSANISTNKGMKLDEEPFLTFKDEISSPVNYSTSQLLGLKMRENMIDVFTFISARDKNSGRNTGVYNINAFAAQQLNRNSFQTWQCYSSKTGVDFIQVSTAEEMSLNFPLETFLINGRLPSPAI